MSEERIVEGVRLSNPDKVLYPEQGITKRELAEHYVAVAEAMLLHVARRPVTMVRCPTGSEKKCFYQRHAGSGVPAQLHEVKIPGFDEPYLYIEDVAGLIAMVQMGVLEIHPWGVTVEQPAKPDRIIFDLDPSEGLGFATVVKAALEVRERLQAIGLESFVKTTGGKGLHVTVPVERGLDWDQFKAFTKAFVEQMERAEPKLYTSNIAKAARKGKIFIDYLRNGRNATFIAPYSPRARAGAPVAVPITWEELAAGVDPAAFTTVTVPKRLAALQADPWADLNATRQRITAAARRSVLA